MPANIAIGAFVFGAILLLLALSSGGFKIFGAEMSAAEGRATRVVAGLCGISLLIFGAWQSLRQEPPVVAAGAAIVPPTQAPGSGMQKPVSPPDQAIAPAANANAPKSDVSMPVGNFSDGEDSVQIAEIFPSPGTVFHRGQPQTFHIRVKYSLVSVDSGILSISVAQIRESSLQCAGKDGQLTDAAQIPISRGVHTTDIVVTWSGDSEQATKNHVDMRGYLRFVPMFWQGGEGKGRGERIKVFEGYEAICMRFES
jgi:hypothetical protein